MTIHKLILALLLLAGTTHAQLLIVISGSKTVTTDTGITFAPVAGAVSNPTTVAFSGAIAGSIYCSTQDGSTPYTLLDGATCGHGTLGATTSITTAVTVQVVSGKLGDMDSAIASAAYTIAAALTAPTYVGSSYGEGNTSATLGHALVANDYVLVFETKSSGTSTPTSASCTFSQVGSTYSAGYLAESVYICQVSGSVTPAVAASGADQVVVAGVHNAAGTPVDALGAGNYGSGGTWSSGTTSTSIQPDLLFAFGRSSTACVAYATGSGWTLAGTVASGYVSELYRTTSSTGTQSALAGSACTSNNWVGIQVAFSGH